MRKDFQLNSEIDNILWGSPLVNAWAVTDNSAFWYHEIQATQYHLSKKEVVKTVRGITLGMTMQDVLNAYGSAITESFNKTKDKIYLINEQSYANEYYNATKTLDKAKLVLVYKCYKDASYAIRFYFDSNKKLIAVCYTRNYDSWDRFDNWSHNDLY